MYLTDVRVIGVPFNESNGKTYATIPRHAIHGPQIVITIASYAFTDVQVIALKSYSR